MRVSIDVLRQAVKSVLPLTGESFKGKGTGGFVILENSMYLVSGSFSNRFAGARVCDEPDEELVDKWFFVSDLSLFLGATHSSDYVDITFNKEKNTILVKCGRPYKNMPYTATFDVAKSINLPPLSSGMQMYDMSIMKTIASASHTSMDNRLNGVYMTGGSDIEMICTDGFLVAYTKFKNELSYNFAVLVPSDYLSYVGRVYWNTYPRMHVVDNKLYFVSDDCFAIGNTLQHETYPAKPILDFYSNVEFGREASIDALDLADKLTALTGVDQRFDRDFIDVSAIKFEFDDERGDLFLSAQSKERGDSGFYLSADGLTYSCILNGHLAKKATQLLRDVNTSKLLFSPADGQNLMLVRPSDSDSLIVGIVPMSH